MRVSHVITRLIVGGAQENTISTVLGLMSKPGVEVTLLSGPTRGSEGSLTNAFDAVPDALRLIPDLVREVNPWRDLAALSHLTEIFSATQPDIVHTHSGKAGILGRLAASRAGVPVIIHTIHGPSFGPFQSAFSNFVFRSAEKHASKSTTHFISVADAMSQQYLSAGIGRPDRYSTIFSGFDLHPYLSSRNDSQLRRSLGIKDTDIVVGKIARLFNLKGHEDVFAIAKDVVSACPRIKFLFVGDGPLKAHFEREAVRLGLQDHFVFTGLVPPSEVSRFVGIMDFLVHLSRREGLPRALPQALAGGKPVIAYSCDGAPEVCLENVTGFLVAPGDLVTLKDRILQLARNPALRLQMGSAGQDFVARKFDVGTMVDQIHQLYLRLLSQS